jgi:hypothetical protein
MKFSAFLSARETTLSVLSGIDFTGTVSATLAGSVYDQQCG